MTELAYRQYIEYIRTAKQVSPITIENYQKAIKTCKIESFDPEKVGDLWKTLLAKLASGVSYGAIRTLFILTKATLKLHGFDYVRNYDYNLLVAKLRQAVGIPEAYSEDEMRRIFKAVQKEDLALLRACILCTYSGLRISAVEGLKFADFKKVEPQGVYAYTVTSKGRKYVAAISEYAYDLLRDTNFDRSEYVCPYESEKGGGGDGGGSSGMVQLGLFAKAYRTRFTYALEKNAMHDVLKGKSPFHSMRKFFAQRLGESPELDSEDIKLLMGHAPKTIAWKHYIDQIDEGMYGKVAQLYWQTSLPTLRLI
jgi:integrase